MVTFVQLDAGKKMQQLHRRQLQLQHSVVVVQVRSAAAVLWHHMHFVFRGTCVLCYVQSFHFPSPLIFSFQAAVVALEARAEAAQ